MSSSEDLSNKTKICEINICYNCNNKVFDKSIKYCPKCQVLLNPNDLKWRKSFILFLLLLFIFPIILIAYTIISYYH